MLPGRSSDGCRIARRGAFDGADGECDDEGAVVVAGVEPGCRAAVELGAQCSNHGFLIGLLGDGDVEREAQRVGLRVREVDPWREHSSQLGLEERASVRRVEQPVELVEAIARLRVRSDEVGDHDAAAGSTHSHHLFDRASGIGDVVEGAAADHEVEGLVDEREAMRVPFLQDDVGDPVVAEATTADLEQFRGQIDADDEPCVLGDLLRDMCCPARDLERAHVFRERLEPGERPGVSAGEGRVGSREQRDLAAEAASDNLIVGGVAHGTTITVLGMSVAARSAKSSTQTANVGVVEMRSLPVVPAGTYVYRGSDLDTGWHTHDLHQLEYALTGIAEVETGEARHLLPPLQAMWLPAGCEHRTTLRGVHSIAVFFDPIAFQNVDERPRVLAAPPVLREMLHYATRWPIGRAKVDPVADTFFTALAAVIRECLDDEMPLSLPTTTDPIIRAAMDETRHDLRASALDVARAAGVSERTLRRRFPDVTGMTWSQYLTAARVHRAIALLVETNDTVSRIAYEVGFGSTSAFTRAFRHHIGDVPSHYRSNHLLAR